MDMDAQTLDLIKACVRQAMSEPRGFRAWNMSVLTYNASKQVNVVRNCFAMMFTNIGDTKVTVNGMVLFASATPTTSLGDAVSIAAHVLDIYKGTIIVQFAAAPMITPLVQVVQLYYLEDSDNIRSVN